MYIDQLNAAYELTITIIFDFQNLKFHENLQKRGTLEMFWTQFRVLH